MNTKADPTEFAGKRVLISGGSKARLLRRAGPILSVRLNSNR
jgi:hypothetical protein